MHTKHLRRVGLVSGSCLLVAFAIIGLWTPSRPPAYNGHTISYWFHELPLTTVGAQSVGMAEVIDIAGQKYGCLHERPRASLTAIQEIGTNGLPFIIRKLSRRVAPLAKRIDVWLVTHGKRPLFVNVEVERRQAVTALLALGSLPPEATLQLRKLSGSGTNSISLAANYVLAAERDKSLRSVIGRYQ